MRFGDVQSSGDFPANLDFGLSGNLFSSDMDISPLSYLDSIMNVPLFDIPDIGQAGPE
jgi:hypothetical protein